MKSIPLFVVGAQGLLAAETLRLAASHSGLGPCFAFSRTPMSDLRAVHPQLPAPQPVLDLVELPKSLTQALADGPAALILATPHGVSGNLWQQLKSDLGDCGADLNALFVVDLSEDHRLQMVEEVGAETGRSAKGNPNIAAWHYGLPELHPIPQGAKLAAAAGCFATALQLAVIPIHRAGLIDPNIPMVFNGVTASSGSGAIAKQGTHHPYRQSNYHPYALSGHRHEKELLHSRNFEQPPKLVFLPHSAPLGRGIYMTAVLGLQQSVGGEQLSDAFQTAYQSSEFIRLNANQAPHLRSVIGSNRVEIGWNMKDGLAQVFVALDNTIKGGAGQGLQCLNLMLGLPETLGLPKAGMGY
jgi:LysW-gamma-L-alpha-aminoadipyl-6-phosphate/LysW-L-glutamyl-5-phosphate reductase